MMQSILDAINALFCNFGWHTPNDEGYCVHCDEWLGRSHH